MCNQNCFTTLFCLLSVRLTAPLLPKDIRQRWLKQNKRKQSKLESRNETDKSIRWCADILRRLGALLAFQSHESLVEGLVAGVHMVMETFHLRMCIVKVRSLPLLTPPESITMYAWNSTYEQVLYKEGRIRATYVEEASSKLTQGFACLKRSHENNFAYESLPQLNIPGNTPCSNKKKIGTCQFQSF